jgi:hypothetical protein
MQGWPLNFPPQSLHRHLALALRVCTGFFLPAPVPIPIPIPIPREASTEELLQQHPRTSLVACHLGAVCAQSFRPSGADDCVVQRRGRRDLFVTAPVADRQLSGFGFVPLVCGCQ